MRILIVLVFLGLLAFVVFAEESSYSKLNFETDCTFKKPVSEDEAGMGSSAICKLAGKPDIYFTDGNLRHSLGFGADKRFASFAGFNNMNSTIEWRHNNDGIFAAIVRFYISGYNDNGELDAKYQKQILLVHKVAKTTADQTCVVGLVDARLNSNANLLAREVADTLGTSFNCIEDRPQYHGEQGNNPPHYANPQPDQMLNDTDDNGVDDNGADDNGQAKPIDPSTAKG